VFFDGVIFIILTAGKVRQAIVNAVPYTLKVAVGAGIGMFIALIGLIQAGIIADNPATLVSSETSNPPFLSLP